MTMERVCAQSIRLWYRCRLVLTGFDTKTSGDIREAGDAPCTVRRPRTSTRSPFATRGRSSFQDGAHDDDPHEADDREDEPRIDSVRCPDPAAHPRRAARDAEHDRSDPGLEQSVGDDPGPPQPERPGHDQHRAWDELITMPAHTRSFSPDVSAPFPAPAIEYARAAHTEMSTRRMLPSAALDAVAAAPQPPCPASRNVLLIAAANHMTALAGCRSVDLSDIVSPTDGKTARTCVRAASFISTSALLPASSARTGTPPGDLR